jgi:hypothetical protein
MIFFIFDVQFLKDHLFFTDNTGLAENRDLYTGIYNVLARIQTYFTLKPILTSFFLCQYRI